MQSRGAAYLLIGRQKLARIETCCTCAYLHLYFLHFTLQAIAGMEHFQFQKACQWL